MRLLQTILVAIVFLHPTVGLGEGVSPTQVVQQWLKVYPTDMAQAAELTTKALREGLSKEEWTASQGPLLQGLKFRYRHGKVLFQEVKRDMAHVVVQARITTFLGDQEQTELYRLQRDSTGQWRIDEVKEYSENYLGFPL